MSKQETKEPFLGLLIKRDPPLPQGIETKPKPLKEVERQIGQILEPFEIKDRLLPPADLLEKFPRLEEATLATYYPELLTYLDQESTKGQLRTILSAQIQIQTNEARLEEKMAPLEAELKRLVEKQRSLKRQKADIQKDLSDRRGLRMIPRFLLQPLLHLLSLRTRPLLQTIKRELKEKTSQVKATEEELTEHAQQHLTAIQPYQEEKTAAEETLLLSFDDWLTAKRERVIIYTLSHPRQAKKTINKFQEVALQNPPPSEVYDYLLFGLNSGFTSVEKVEQHLFNQWLSRCFPRISRNRLQDIFLHQKEELNLLIEENVNHFVEQLDSRLFFPVKEDFARFLRTSLTSQLKELGLPIRLKRGPHPYFLTD